MSSEEAEGTLGNGRHLERNRGRGEMLGRGQRGHCCRAEPWSPLRTQDILVSRQLKRTRICDWARCSQERSRHEATPQLASFLPCTDSAGFLRARDVWVLPRHRVWGEAVDGVSQEAVVHVGIRGAPPGKFGGQGDGSAQTWPGRAGCPAQWSLPCAK